MIEMARLGAGVMETTSVEIGYRRSVPIYVNSSTKETKGTYITEVNNTYKNIIGIAINDNTSILKIENILSKSDDISLIFEILSKENLEIKMINQIASDNEHTNLSFVVNKGDLGCIDEAMNEIKSRLIVVLYYDFTHISEVGI